MENQIPNCSDCRQRPVIDHNYPLKMACTFRAYRDGESIEEGAGETEVISSKAIRFRASRQVARHATDLSVSVAWPIALEDGTALQVVFSGRPIWDDEIFAGIVIERYEFRTRRTASGNLGRGAAAAAYLQTKVAASSGLPFPLQCAVAG
jgi:hypothetical protein